jgi:hypothetical protein
MTLRNRTTSWALTGLIRLDWRIARAATRLGEAGVYLENWVDRRAAYRCIPILDVLAPLTERHSGAGEV